MSTFQLFKSLGSGPRGLTESEAAARGASSDDGADCEPDVAGLFHRFTEAVSSPFLALLASLTLVFAVLGDARAAVTLSVMIVAAVALRVWQQGRADRAVASLRRGIPTTTTVRRRAADGAPATEREVPVNDLVPGDVVVLRPGDVVPVDVRITSASGLTADQSSISGESLPVGKSASSPMCAEPAPTSAVPRLCLGGATIVSGCGTGIVVATGANTYSGGMAENAARLVRRSSFDRGVQAVGGTLIRLMLVMIPVVFVIRGMVDGVWTQAAVLAVAVAVGLTPEMLPVIVSSNLSRAAMQMARRNVIVNRLHAIQDLGAMTVLCVDKTGTLTEDRIVHAHSVNAAGQPDVTAAEFAHIAEVHRGDIDTRYGGAIAHLARHDGDPASEDLYTKVDEIEFDYVRRMSTVVLVRERGHHLMICRGDPDQVIACCRRMRTPTGEVDLAARREEVNSALTDCYSRGMQVQAVGVRVVPARLQHYTEADERDLVLLGFLCFLDPLRANAADTITALAEFGVTVKIVTGDTAVVAAEVATRSGLEAAKMLCGYDLDHLDDAQLAVHAADTTVFAELTPAQKARVVTALQRSGEVVGFVGDGVNDVTALRLADAGIAADTATAAAKAAADMILLDRSLTVIADGVVEGRRTLANTMKYVRITASSNFGNALSVVAASALLPIVPILPVQLLVQNLLYDVAQLALPWDRVHPGYLRRPRRWCADGLTEYIVVFGLLSSMFDLLTFAALWFGFGGQHDPAIFRSGWFIEGLLSQLLIVQVLRTRGAPWGPSRAGGAVLTAALLAAAVGCLLPISPLAGVLQMRSPPGSYGVWVAATLAVYGFSAYAVKRWWPWRSDAGNHA